MHPCLLALRIADTLLTFLLVFLIFHRRLRPRYAAFSTWLFVSGSIDAALLWLPHETILYAELWSLSQPFLWVLQLLAVQEVMFLVTEQYPELGAAAKVITSSSFIVGIVAAGVSVFCDWSSATRIPLWLDVTWRGTRYVSCASCFVLVFQVLWFALFPAPMVPNVKTHRLLFTFYGGILPTLALFIGDVGSQRLNDYVNVAYLSGVLVTLSCWIGLLRSDREYSPFTARTGQQASLGNIAKFNVEILRGANSE